MPGASWLTPASIRSWYGFNNVTFSNGTITGDGSGQTIAIIDWGDDPSIGDDLDVFDQQYGVSNAGGTPSLYAQYGASSSFLTVYAQNGTTSQFLPRSSDPGA